MKLSIVRSAVVVAAMSLLLAGCAAGSDTGQPSGPQNSGAPGADGWDAVEEAADAEGTLIVYSPAPPKTNDALAAAFKKDYPDIQVNIAQLSSVEIQQRSEAERAGNTDGADVMMTTDGAWHADKAEEGDFFATIVGPNATAGVGADRELLTGDGQVLTVAATPLGLAWSKDQVSGDLTLDDLATDPAFKGKLGLLDFAISDVFTIELYLYSENYGGDDFLRKLAAQDPRYYPTAVPMAQAMAAGEIAVSAQMTQGSVGDLPLTLKFPDEVTIASPYYASVNTAARNPNAGQVFVDWLLSQSAQDVYAELNGVSVAGLVPNTPVDLEALQLIKMEDYDQKFIDDYKAHLSEIFGH